MTAITNQPETDRSITRSALRSRMLKKRAWYLGSVQMAVLLMMTALFERFDVDRQVAAHFYRTADGWFLATDTLWVWLYNYGTIPGLLISLSALVVFLGSLWLDRLKPWRKPCLLMVLTTVIAAGLLVNAVLKQYWGRPRPDQTIEFGGNWEYRPIFSPGTPGKGASFPCGHCTMGFVLLSMAGFHRRSRALAVGGVGAGVVLGVLLSAARIVQGAHFLSDTIWSLGIVSMTATILHAYLGSFSMDDASAGGRSASRSFKIRIGAAVFTAVVIMAAGFMTRRPFYRTMVYPFKLESSLEAVAIRINADPERIMVKYSQQEDGRLQVDAHGFGWLKFDYHMGNETHTIGPLLSIFLNVNARSYFAELDHRLTLALPRNTEHHVTVMVNDRLIDGMRP